MGTIYSRPPAALPESRCAAQIGSTDTRMSEAATTLTTGAALGLKRFSKTQMGTVFSPATS